MAGAVARVVVLAALAAVLVGLMAHYAAAAPAHDPYPTAEEVHADYDAHVGEEVHYWGRVVETSGSGFVVGVEDLRLRVDSDADVSTGDTVQVYGVLAPDDQVYGVLAPDDRLDARTVVVSKQEGKRYMWVVSALGGLLAALYALYHWRPDVRTLRLEGRDA